MNLCEYCNRYEAAEVCLVCGRATVTPEGASLAADYITGAEIAGAVRQIPEGKVALIGDYTNYHK